MLAIARKQPSTDESFSSVEFFSPAAKPANAHRLKACSRSDSMLMRVRGPGRYLFYLQRLAAGSQNCYLRMFAAGPVSGLQPDEVFGFCFPGAGAPGCVASGFQPEFFGLESAARDVGRSIFQMFF